MIGWGRVGVCILVARLVGAYNIIQFPEVLVVCANVTFYIYIYEAELAHPSL